MNPQTANLPPEPQPHSTPLMQNRSYLALMAAQLVSNIGTYMHSLALIWLMNLLTGGSAFWMSMIAVAQIIPAVLIGPFSGVWVDRWNKLLTMRVVDLVATVLVGAIATLAYLGQITPLSLLAITFLLSATTTFFNPAKQVLLTHIVARDDLLKANSVSQTIQTLCLLGGPVLAGILIASIGPYLVFALDAGTFLLSFLFLALIRFSEAKQEAKQESDSNFWAEFREGFDVAWTIPVIKSAIPIALAINFLFAPMSVFLAKMVTDVYQGGARELGILESGFGLGMLIGAVTISLLNKVANKGTIFFIGLFGSAFGCMILSLSSTVWMGVVGGAVFGLMNIWVNITFSTVLQQSIPQEKMGRVFGLVSTMMNGSQPLANLTFGSILGLFLINQLLLALSVLFAITNLIALTRKPLRQM